MNSIFNSMDISASALTAQRVRMNVISSNLANAQTTRTPEGGPYKRQDVVFSAQSTDPSQDDPMEGSFENQLKSVKVVEIFEDKAEPKKVFNPTHVDADKDGFVKLPNIQVTEEMVNMILASRAYEANTTIFNETKSMAQKSIEIGR